MSILDIFVKVELALEPYVVAGGMVTSGVAIIGAGVVTTVTGYGSMPATGPAGALIGTAGVMTTISGVGIFTTGVDIYSDQLRDSLDLPDWFDVIPDFDFFPPHGDHDDSCN